MTDIDSLARDIMGQFTEWTETVTRSVDKKVKESAESLREEISTKSPKKTGAYAKGWAVKPQRSGGQQKYVVHNKDRYQLTHLLEKGHAKRKGGRVAAIPHIVPAADKHIGKLVTDIQGIIRNGG
ncbi:HK97 gp10 family phage protein [Paenibacillus wenxiniae]|uniref:HK97 gp10 family phage protein n=1 Tax=Paenibacillus wenxiniae TaxID=1636843 RepID=A0ABW4RH15_9BACL